VEEVRRTTLLDPGGEVTERWDNEGGRPGRGYYAGIIAFKEWQRATDDDNTRDWADLTKREREWWAKKEANDD
jgi:hypothetical protein